MTQFSNTLSVTLAKFVIRWRWALLLATLGLAFVAASGMQHLMFINDYEVFFSDENPQLKAYQELQKKYTKDDNIYIAIAPKDGNVFTNRTLELVANLTAEGWKTPFSTRVDALTNYQHTRSVEDDLYVEDLVQNPKSARAEELEEAKTIAIAEPLLKNRLISENGAVTGINITLNLPGKSPTEVLDANNYIREVIEKYRTDYPDVDFYITGVAMLSGAFGEASQHDVSTLIPLMFGIIFITILLTLRSISSMFSTFIILIMSIFTAMGMAGWLGIHLTAPVMSAPTMILTLAVADSIHILITIIQQMRKGLSKNDAIIESLRLNFIPVLVTSLTTVIGFLTMNFSDVPPFHDLGNITAMGITAAFLYSIVTLPALVSILPLKVKRVDAKETSQTGMDRLANFIIRNNRKVLLTSVATIILGGLFMMKNELNDEFVKYFDTSVQFRKDTDFLAENMTGIYTIEFSLNSGENGGVNNPTYLKNVEKFANWYRSQEHVVHVNAFTDVSKRVNKSMHGDDQAFYAIPESREESAQYLLLYEMSLPYGLDINNQVNVTKSETRFIITLENIKTGKIIELAERGENWLKTNTPEYMHSNATSTALMFSHLNKRNIDSMMSGNAWAILLISITMMIALRSVKFGSLSILPNVAPILVGFGVWGIFKGQVDNGLAIVFSMTLGIVVDDTVHLISKYLRAVRELNYSPEDAVRYAFKTVGTAIVVTTVVLSAGFLILSQSAFRMNSGMAQLTTITIVLALLIDFFMLPPLLLLISKKKKNAAEIKQHEPELIG